MFSDGGRLVPEQPQAVRVCSGDQAGVRQDVVNLLPRYGVGFAVKNLKIIIK